MQTQLFISSLLAFVSLAPPSFACGPEGPLPLPAPQVSVSEEAQHIRLQLKGATAETLFQHLADPEVKLFERPAYALRIGYGIACSAQQGLTYTCWEKLDDEGAVKNFLPYKDQLKDSKSWLRLNIKAPTMEILYNRMSDDGDLAENEDGSLDFIKQRTAITCTKRVSSENAPTFECSQLLSGGGLPIGPGSDPMIGSGTHPVQIDVAEGEN